MELGRKRTILEVVSKVLQEADQGRGWPTELVDIACLANIDLMTANSHADVDGRFEILDGRPAIFLNLRGSDLGKGRVRFSLGHELGHYFLHRHLVKGWTPHNDNFGFNSVLTQIEEEANFFSSCLLFPRDLLAAFLKLREICSRSVADLAKQACASAHAAAIAISQSTEKKCMFLYEEAGLVKWVAASDDWVESKFRWSHWIGKEVPEGSHVAIHAPQSEDIVEDDLHVWCPSHHWLDGKMSVSALPLSIGRMIIVNCDLGANQSDDDDDW